MIYKNVTKEKDIIDSSGYKSSVECIKRFEDYKHTGQFHFHKYCEILFCIKGKITVICGNSSIKLDAGDMIYLSANEIHTIEYEEDYSEHYCIKFDPKLFGVINNFDADTFGNIIISRLNKYEYFSKDQIDACNYNIENLFCLAISEYSKPNYSNNMLVKAYVMQIAAFIIDQRISDGVMEFDSDFVQKVSGYLEENYSTATLKEAAGVSNISYNYFSALFHKSFGVSFKKYLNQIKINKSVILLKNKSKTITDIAFELGFSSSSHYVNTFKKIKETTPNEFRKTL